MSFEDNLQEITREGLNIPKITHTLGVFFAGKTAAADAYLESFIDFDPEILREVTGKKIKNVLLDIDGCVAPQYGPILPENLQQIGDLLQQGVRVAVYSNCKAMNRLQPLRDMGIQIYDGNIAKPSKEGFLKVCEIIGFDPAETWMVGDNPTTDGGAIGVLEGMAFIKAIPVDPKYVKSPLKRLAMYGANFIRDLSIRRTFSS